MNAKKRMSLAQNRPRRKPKPVNRLNYEQLGGPHEEGDRDDDAWGSDVEDIDEFTEALENPFDDPTKKNEYNPEEGIDDESDPELATEPETEEEYITDTDTEEDDEEDIELMLESEIEDSGTEDEEDYVLFETDPDSPSI